MFNRFRVAPVLGLMLALGVPATSMAEAPDKSAHAPCALRELRVTKVTPYRVQRYVGRGTMHRGANVFVRAEPGLTAEWLEHQLRRHLAAMNSTEMPNCPLDIARVRVQVDSGRAGFWVRLIAPDARTGREVLRRAQLLLG